jgi:ABC-2 type transport system permease protein
VSQAVVIARASLAEHSRRRLTLFFLLASVLLTTPLVYLARSPDASRLVDTPRALAALASLGILRYLALFATIAVSMGNIGRPFASGEALTVLARPVARWQYALGRLLGSISFAIGFCLVLAVETTVVQMVTGGALAGTLWAHWASTAFNLVLIATIATVASAVIANPVLVAVTTYFAYLTINALGGVNQVIASGRISSSLARWFEIAYTIGPKLLPSPLAIRAVTEEAGGVVDALRTSPALVATTSAWILALTALAMWITTRKDV